jgi:hypothetical protein
MGGFMRACIAATGGNPFWIEELLDEVAARGINPTAPAAPAVPTIVSHGVANAVLIRFARPTQIPEVQGISDVSWPSTTLCVATANGGELLVCRPTPQAERRRGRPTRSTELIT